MVDHRDAIIIGAGMSGLMAAIRLKKAGLTNIALLEKSDDVGGTWLENIYPGAGCDVPSHLYSYSFEPKPDWSRLYGLQPEILEYFRDVTIRHDLYAKTYFGTQAMRAAFSRRHARWVVQAANGRSWNAPILILATGQLNRPHIPHLTGSGSFQGEEFHSARWNPMAELEGKRIGVVGNGASAVQFIPEIAPQAAKLTIFQRSPNWIIPRGDSEYGALSQWAFRNVPGARAAMRHMLYESLEANWKILSDPDGPRARKFARKALKNLAKFIDNPQLRSKLTPNYAIGCKRILISDDYYPALARRNVWVETAPITGIEPDGLRLVSGQLVRLDVLIWATGFETHNFVAPLSVRGLDGRMLEAEWGARPQAYRGTTVSGYPNMFVLYGPNTNLGHNSIIFMVEKQMDYVMQAVKRLTGGEPRYLDVRGDVQEAHNAAIQAELGDTAWAAGCNSWYKTEDGHIGNNWPGSTRRFAKEMQRFDAEAYEMVTVG